MITLDDLRRFAVARSLFPPTSLGRALETLGFVQADPIRAPARAQDLILRHRVRQYRAGDLERFYSTLDVEEDVFVNYGFVTRSVHALMHPRADRPRWGNRRSNRAQALVEFVQARGAVHPREVDAHFSHGTVTNYWGGSSNATTHLLDDLHYRGLLRVLRRDGGIRVYAIRNDVRGPDAADDPAARRGLIDRLVDVVVHLYAPLPGTGLSSLVRRLRHAAPQWRGELGDALQRARRRLSHTQVDGIDWYWPAGESVRSAAPPTSVRLLAPFDPVVWDRRRFEIFWQWAYRFEAYTPVRKRKLGYYALPLLWRDRVVGWSNVSAIDGEIQADLGFIRSRPRDRLFTRELDAELDRIRTFLRPR